MLSQPLKDTTVTSETREAAFEQGQTWRWEVVQVSLMVFSGGLTRLLELWYIPCLHSTTPLLCNHHNILSIANIFTLKWTTGVALSGAEYSSEPMCQQQHQHLEQWSRNQSIKTSTTYNNGQSPFTAKHHNPSQTEVCEKVHAPSKSGRI